MIFEQYKSWIYGVSFKMFCDYDMRVYREDLLQEAFVAINQSWQTFRFYYHVPFEVYLKKNIVYKFLSFKRKILNDKNLAMYKYETLDKINNFNTYNNFSHTSRVEMHDMILILREILSPFEFNVLKECIVDGKSQSIADNLATDVESVYNAKARIKRKVEKVDFS